MISSKEILNLIFKEEISNHENELNEVNNLMFSVSGITHFFNDYEELKTWKEWYNEGVLNVGSREYGDFQTPSDLADRVCKVLIKKGIDPSSIVEPTYGKGNFIHASIENFQNVKKVYGVEIQKSYEMHFKKSLLEKNTVNILQDKDIKLEIYQDDFFKHEFPDYLLDTKEDLLFIGNPPWVTIAELKTLNSTNMPEKSNFKKHQGLDAITGKANFDVSEYIIIKLLDLLSVSTKGSLALLCKNSVAKNIVYSLPDNEWNTTTIDQYNFDAKKEFNVNTEASLLLIKVGEKNKTKAKTCNVYDLDEPDKLIKTYGWLEDKFISNIEDYIHGSMIDNKSQFVWRSGVKHDSSKIMELSVLEENTLQNGLKEIIDIENEPVYNLLKSSDLKKDNIPQTTRKKVIITQHKTGQDTSYIQYEFPKLWHYLNTHREYLDNRKSSIYKGKPSFSIFGIGEYSFSPYKVAISGMYKKSNFALIAPINNKPVFLDDTCYFLSFDYYNDALFTFLILNSDLIQGLLKSLVFSDAKRPYTKDILMRIDILEASKQLNFDELLEVASDSNIEIPAGLSEKDYSEYIIKLSNKPETFFGNISDIVPKNVHNEQTSLF